ncbi:MAG: aminotransferase class I/II-fold pyridoxal phosphate-dependent enzyme, partial [Cyanobacteria bacterium J06553_1]
MAFLRDDLAQLAAYKSPHPIAEDTLAGNSSHQGSVQPVLDPLDTNESPTDLPDEIKADLAEAYQSAIEANRYPDGTCLLLKQAVMSYVAGSGNISPETITAENITLGNGSDELIRSVIMATCLGGHGSILVADPTFSMYAILAKTLGVKVHHVSRDDSFAVDLAAAQAAIDSAQSDGLPVRTIFMVHPNSP